MPRARAVRFQLTEQPPTLRTKPRHSDPRIVPRGILRIPRTLRTQNRSSSNVSQHQTVVHQGRSGRNRSASLSTSSSTTLVCVNTQPALSHKRQAAVDFGRSQPFTNVSNDVRSAQHTSSTVHCPQPTRQALMPLTPTPWNQPQPPVTTNFSIYRPSTPSRFTPYAPPSQYTNREWENRVPAVQHAPYLLPSSPMHWTSVPSQPPPEPSLTASTIHLGPYLHDRNFSWNIIHSPSFAAYFSAGGVPPDISMHATDPPIPKLTIKFSLAHLSDWNLKQWDPLVVRGTGSQGVTIRDVIEGIYAYFQTPLRYHEYNYRNIEDYRLLMNSYARRVTSLRYQGLGLPHEDLRRVDVLLGATHFMGLKLASVRDGRVKFFLSLGYDSSY
ncbi:uncharacterized protein LACBIDRAFT_298604 [Laccaria bicolor S238N-H82]|uniref:Predicted protein n=1 Tax=Laccaria bicolor (strain S238N-H82 / ATCC MYA-4686) TaxID=486041 RepID=B0DD74_LACBS|nr:uncharacterized protein LACBIDRAFT_298604 [Laccaria bicolor S238N-H82]EDR07557.1 predicted protein [Laccaria bicolor S238N-H82]|eukprot:XP_001881949.1 predicted protein [Laccaria bicolor S238N-H82]